jgi:hypothetical protein
MSPRMIEILKFAAQAPSPGWVSTDGIAEAIKPNCPGPRTAGRYARELIWELFSRNLIERSARREQYRITHEGLELLAALTNAAPAAEGKEAA